MFSTLKNKFSLEGIGRGALLATMFLIAIVFFPGGIISPLFFKSVILFVGVIVALSCFVIGAVRTNTIQLPAPLFWAPSLLLLVTYLISASFSIQKNISFIGYGFENGTVHFIALLALFAFLVQVYFKTKKDLFLVLSTFFSSIVLLFVFQVVRLLGGENFLSLGNFFVTASSPIGRWNELAVVSALAIFFSLIALQVLSLPRLAKGFVYVFIVLSFLFIVLSNFVFHFPFFTTAVSLPVIIGLVALVFLGYFYSVRSKKNITVGSNLTSRLSIPSLVVFVIALVLVVGGRPLNEKLSSYFKVVYSEGRPSWAATASIADKTLSQKLLLGSGPETFSHEWALYKPAAFNNQNIFWDVDFSLGIGFVPTAFITGGLLVGSAWILFVLSILYISYRVMKNEAKDQMTLFLKATLVSGTLYLLFITTFYIPGVALLVLLFLFVGALFAYAERELAINGKSLVFDTSEGKKIFASFVMISLLVLLSVWTITFGKKVTASVLATLGIQKASVGDIDNARTSFFRAVALDEQSLYLKLIAQNALAGLSQVVSKTTEDNIQQFREPIQMIVNEAVAASERAEVVESTNFRNKLATGAIYESLARFGAPDLYVRAIEKYDQTKVAAPTSPLPYLLQARVEVNRGNLSKAKEYIAGAISLKNDYIDAYLFLSDIAIQQGDKKASQAILENVLVIDPTNIAIKYQVGLLKYDAKNYTAAISDFTNALTINPFFANARYFLALSLYRTGDTEGAIREMKKVLETNPENTEVKTSIEKLEKGESLFTVPKVDDSKKEEAKKAGNEKTVE